MKRLFRILGFIVALCAIRSLARAESVIVVVDDLSARPAYVQRWDADAGLLWSYTLDNLYGARMPRTGYLDNDLTRHVHISIERINVSSPWTDLRLRVDTGASPIYTDRDNEPAPTFGTPDNLTSDILCSTAYETTTPAFIQWNRNTGVTTYHHFNGTRRVWMFRRSLLRNSIVGFNSTSQVEVVEYVPASNVFNYLPAPAEGFFSVIQEFACPLAASGRAWAITSDVATDYLAAEIGTNPNTWPNLGGGTAASIVIDRTDGLFVLGDTSDFHLKRIRKNDLTIDWSVPDQDPEPKVIDTTETFVWTVGKHDGSLYLQARRRSDGMLYSEFVIAPFDGVHDGICIIAVGPAIAG